MSRFIVTNIINTSLELCALHILKAWYISIKFLLIIKHNIKVGIIKFSHNAKLYQFIWRLKKLEKFKKAQTNTTR